MRESLRSGIESTFSFQVTENKTVPHLYPESPEFQDMPHVFATGFLVGLVEWACIRAIQPHLDGPDEQSVGTHVNLSHSAATPPGGTVTVRVRLDQVQRRTLSFSVSAHDDLDEVCRGTHERHVIDRPRFEAKVALKSRK